ncbi:MAG: hypothetical protein SNJ77_01900 [Cytophagales bacterium]
MLKNSFLNYALFLGCLLSGFSQSLVWYDKGELPEAASQVVVVVGGKVLTEPEETVYVLGKSSTNGNVYVSKRFKTPEEPFVLLKGQGNCSRLAAGERMLLGIGSTFSNNNLYQFSFVDSTWRAFGVKGVLSDVVYDGRYIYGCNDKIQQNTNNIYYFDTQGIGTTWSADAGWCYRLARNTLGRYLCSNNITKQSFVRVGTNWTEINGLSKAITALTVSVDNIHNVYSVADGELYKFQSNYSWIKSNTPIVDGVQISIKDVFAVGDNELWVIGNNNRLYSTKENPTNLSDSKINSSVSENYPNPSFGEYDLSADLHFQNFKVFTLSGVLIKESKATTKLNITDLSSGTYTISFGEKHFKSEKLRK